MSQRRNYYHVGRHPYEQDYCDKCHKPYDYCDCKYQGVCNKCYKEYEFCTCKEPYQEEGALVEKVICSKNVQKTAEFLLPASIGPSPLLNTVLELVSGLVNVRVTPDFSNIQTEITVIKDKVINLGYIPATLDIEGETLLGVPLVSLPIQIFFQEHTDCPGICPGDKVIETTPVVEAVLNEPLLNNANGGTSINLLLFKAIVRTHITVIRQGIKKGGVICDLDSHRCEVDGMPQKINSPVQGTPNTQPIQTTGGGGGPA